MPSLGVLDGSFRPVYEFRRERKKENISNIYIYISPDIRTWHYDALPGHP